ncbi:MAG: hypothetical protein HZC28_17485 [Spirochaetes bacterium]|nr:hypothetical protein [Spirochaetota bacterium]
MSAQWIDHKGKKIIYIKYGGLTQPQMLDQIREATKMIVESGSNENLSLTDMTDTHIFDEFMELAKIEGAKSLPLTKKAAIVGVVGVKRILLNAVNMVSPKARKPFDTIEQAKDWLVE